jgi:hypothetical protein
MASYASSDKLYHEWMGLLIVCSVSCTRELFRSDVGLLHRLSYLLDTMNKTYESYRNDIATNVKE